MSHLSDKSECPLEALTPLIRLGLRLEPNGKVVTAHPDLAKKSILEDTPDARLFLASRADKDIADMDMIVTSTSGAGKEILDIMRVKPGCVITDVARPLDLPPEEVAKRVKNNAARRELIKEGKAHVGDGKDVAHKRALENGGSNARSNLTVQSRKENRGWRKGSGSYNPDK